MHSWKLDREEDALSALIKNKGDKIAAHTEAPRQGEINAVTCQFRQR